MSQEQRVAAGSGILVVKVFLEVEGDGSFTAGRIDTLDGLTSAWVPEGMTLSLKATPAPGWRFSHWTFDDLFGGSSPKSFVSSRPNLKVKAVFVKP